MDATIRYAWGSSSLGDFIAACSESGLVALEFMQRDEASMAAWHAGFAPIKLIEDAVGMATMVSELAALIEQPWRKSPVPLDPQGSAFERQVWQALREIPAGATTSYGAIAARIAQPNMAREVAQACAANALAVVIPCHRVLKKDGSISGYRWGVRRKRALLEREARA